MKKTILILALVLAGLQSSAAVIRLVPTNTEKVGNSLPSEAQILKITGQQVEFVKTNILCADQGLLQEESSLKQYGFHNFKACQKVQKLVKKSSSTCPVVLELGPGKQFVENSYLDCEEF